MELDKKILCFLLISFAAGVISCNKSNNDCFKSAGNLVRETRTLPDFFYLKVYNNVNVILSQSLTNSIAIDAGENLMHKIIAEVVDDTLIIRNNNKCNWIRNHEMKVTAYIGVIDLRMINHNGYGEVTSANKIISNLFYISNQANGDIILDVDNTYTFCDIHGSGDLNLTGNTGGIDIWSSGQHWIRCRNLLSPYTSIYTKTTGDCYIYGSDSVNIVLDGNGNVFYSGNPSKVIKKIVGTGTISPI